MRVRYHTDPHGIFKDGIPVIASLITDQFLDTDTETLSHWLDWECRHCTRRDIRAAQKLVEEVRLLDWIDMQNSIQGVAPPFEWDYRCQHRVLAGPGHSNSSAAPFTSAGAVKWMQKFRKRWDLCLGRQPVHEIIPLQCTREKAVRAI